MTKKTNITIKNIRKDYEEIVFNFQENDIFMNIIMLWLLADKIDETDGESDISFVVIDDKGKQENHYLELTWDSDKYYNSLTEEDEYADDILIWLLAKIIKCNVKKKSISSFDQEINYEELEKDNVLFFDIVRFDTFYNIKSLANLSLRMKETEYSEDIPYSIIDKTHWKTNYILKSINPEEQIYNNSLTKEDEYADYILVSFAEIIIGECEKK